MWLQTELHTYSKICVVIFVSNIITHALIKGNVNLLSFSRLNFTLMGELRAQGVKNYLTAFSNKTFSSGTNNQCTV